MPGSTITDRCKRLRLSNKVIAKRSGLDENTVGRALRDGNPLRSTLLEIEKAVTTEELELLRHLARLYPQEAIAACCPEQGRAA
jgi:transcriptional regulator with XRE-family HTH domain